MTILSATSLCSDNVQNVQGENLGSIKDIMINTATNDVEYYVLSFGGVLGMGDKLFAVPPQAINVDTEKKCMILNVSKERLENAEGFDKDEWPNFADPKFKQNLYSYYGVTEDTVKRAA